MADGHVPSGEHAGERGVAKQPSPAVQNAFSSGCSQLESKDGGWTSGACAIQSIPLDSQTHRIQPGPCTHARPTELDDIVHGAARPGAVGQRCFDENGPKVTPQEGATERVQQPSNGTPTPQGSCPCPPACMPPLWLTAHPHAQAVVRVYGLPPHHSYRTSVLPHAVDEWVSYMKSHGIGRVVSLLSDSEVATYQVGRELRAC